MAALHVMDDNPVADVIVAMEAMAMAAVGTTPHTYPLVDEWEICTGVLCTNE